MRNLTIPMTQSTKAPKANRIKWQINYQNTKCFQKVVLFNWSGYQTLCTFYIISCWSFQPYQGSKLCNCNIFKLKNEHLDRKRWRISTLIEEKNWRIKTWIEKGAFAVAWRKALLLFATNSSAGTVALGTWITEWVNSIVINKAPWSRGFELGGQSNPKQWATLNFIPASVGP